MNASEIVTLQIGHYSNFVGSHWWNCQESSFVYDPNEAAKYPKEVDHDVLYREGRTRKGEVTYTPRLVAFDLSYSLGSVKREGILYDITGDEDVKWDGDVTLHQAQGAHKNSFLQDLDWQEEDGERERERYPDKRTEESDILSPEHEDGEKKNSLQDFENKEGGRSFYQLDDEVRVWSDFLRTSLHSKSVHIIKEYQHNNKEQPFEVFGVGKQVLASRESMDAMEDRIRFFTEECDQLQGFHILLDSHDAFGGFASPILTYLEEEYPSKARLSFSLSPTCPPDETARERACRIINSGLSLQACVRHNSLNVPLSLASSLWKRVGDPVTFPHLQYKADLNYHTSGILATVLDTLSLPYRNCNTQFKMADITSTFSGLGRKLAAVASSLPLPIQGHSSLTDHLMALGDCDPWMSLTPHVKCASAPAFQSCVVRGLLNNIMTSETKHGSRGPPPTSGPLAHCTSVEDVLRLYLSEMYPSCVSAGCVMRDPVRLDKSFPHVFKPCISPQGFIADTSRLPLCGVTSVPVMTSLQSTPDLMTYVDSLTQCLSQMNIRRHPDYLKAGLDPDDFGETLQDLQDLSQCYSSSTSYT